MSLPLHEPPLHDPAPPFAARRARGLAAVAVLALLSLALAKDAARTALGVGQLTAIRILDWRGHEQALRTADTGREGLPPAVVPTVAALKAGSATAFRLSPGAEQDALLRQRLSEVAWPLPIDPTASVLVRLANEPSTCVPLAQNAGVAVDRCD